MYKIKNKLPFDILSGRRIRNFFNNHNFGTGLIKIEDNIIIIIKKNFFLIFLK